MPHGSSFCIEHYLKFYFGLFVLNSAIMFLILTKSCCFYPENLSAYDCFEIDEFTVQCEYVVMTSSNI